MCVICISPAGRRLPRKDEMEAMFEWNPHGAGYMFAKGGKVYIHKGFMDLDTFIWSLENEGLTDDIPVVLHFRISTQAGVNPEMTHPFPLSNRKKLMKALDVACPCGVAHNGVIPLTTDKNNHEYSDTALFISEYLSKIIRGPEDLHDGELLDKVGRLIQSKMAILDGSGYIATIGKFYEEYGLLYSNLNHNRLLWRKYAR